jgi:hypothetical protein
MPEIAVPLATQTGWNPSDPKTGAPDALAGVVGSYIPFARHEAAREASGDPRLSIEERYADRAAYLGRVAEAALALQRDRLLLAEDVPVVIERARRPLGLAGRQAVTRALPAELRRPQGPGVDLELELEAVLTLTTPATDGGSMPSRAGSGTLALGFDAAVRGATRVERDLHLDRASLERQPAVTTSLRPDALRRALHRGRLEDDLGILRDLQHLGAAHALLDRRDVVGRLAARDHEQPGRLEAQPHGGARGSSSTTSTCPSASGASMWCSWPMKLMRPARPSSSRTWLFAGSTASRCGCAPSRPVRPSAAAKHDTARQEQSPRARIPLMAQCTL